MPWTFVTQRVHGLLDDQPDADRRGEVVDDVALVDELAHDRRREHRVDDEVEVRARRAGARRWRATPVERSSSAKTSQPSASRSSERWEPMKPAPPVMSALPVLVTGQERSPPSPGCDRLFG